jgi:hypothetical protein
MSNFFFSFSKCAIFCAIMCLPPQLYNSMCLFFARRLKTKKSQPNSSRPLWRSTKAKWGLSSTGRVCCTKSISGGSNKRPVHRSPQCHPAPSYRPPSQLLLSSHWVGLAQEVEQLPCNREVASSVPSSS